MMIRILSHSDAQPWFVLTLVAIAGLPAASPPGRASHRISDVFN